MTSNSCTEQGWRCVVVNEASEVKEPASKFQRTYFVPLSWPVYKYSAFVRLKRLNELIFSGTYIEALSTSLYTQYPPPKMS